MRFFLGGRLFLDDKKKGWVLEGEERARKAQPCHRSLLIYSDVIKKGSPVRVKIKRGLLQEVRVWSFLVLKKGEIWLFRPDFGII